MLLSIDTGSEIDWIPHPGEYQTWTERLDPGEFDAIFAELQRRIEGTEIQTSSWIPGADWSGTVFILYTRRPAFRTPFTPHSSSGSSCGM